MDLFLRDSELRFPIPGVEPGPKDGKSPILTVRPYRKYSFEETNNSVCANRESNPS